MDGCFWAIHLVTDLIISANPWQTLPVNYAKKSKCKLGSPPCMQAYTIEQKPWNSANWRRWNIKKDTRKSYSTYHSGSYQELCWIAPGLCRSSCWLWSCHSRYERYLWRRRYGSSRQMLSIQSIERHSFTMSEWFVQRFLLLYLIVILHKRVFSLLADLKYH